MFPLHRILLRNPLSLLNPFSLSLCFPLPCINNKTKSIKAKQNETKSTHKKHDVCFVLFSHPWGWGLPWSMVDIWLIYGESIGEKKLIFPFPFMVRGRTLCLLHFLHAVILSGLGHNRIDIHMNSQRLCQHAESLL